MKSLQECLNESLNEASVNDKDLLYMVIDTIKKYVKKSRVKEVSRRDGVCVNYVYSEDLFYDIENEFESIHRKNRSQVTMDLSTTEYFTLEFDNLGMYIEVSEDVGANPELRIGFYREDRKDADAEQLCVDAYKYYVS